MRIFKMTFFYFSKDNTFAPMDVGEATFEISETKQYSAQKQAIHSRYWSQIDIPVKLWMT